MARAQFDRESVVEKSIQLFWQKGYNGSSMQEVVSCTSLKPGSIYLAFGNKEGLYREALQHYALDSKSYITETLVSSPSVAQGICHLLEQMVEVTRTTDYCSCFLIKTQLELASERGPLFDFASEKLCEIEALYETYLQQAYGDKGSTAKATSLMLHIFGVRVYGYKDQSTQRIMTALREGLPWLPWSEYISDDGATLSN